MNAVDRLDAILAEAPVIAILRGLRPDDSEAIGDALFDAGIRVMEVPVHSPDPFASIARLRARFEGRAMVGAGTVTSVDEVERVAASGGELAVSPVVDPSVIRRALDMGLAPVPGYATPTEAFAAMAAGARHLKMFPAGGRACDLRALTAVLPSHARVVAVGGVSPANMAAFKEAGCFAFGIGSEIYRPGAVPGDVRNRAAAALAAATAAKRSQPEIFAAADAEIGESPVWLGGEVGLIWTDPVSRRLLRAQRSGGPCATVATGQPVWSLAAAPDGTLMGTVDTGFCAVDADSGALRCGPSANLPAGCRFNDMAVDSRGRFWAGSMHRAVLGGRGAIHAALSLDAVPHEVAGGLGVANGMAFSQDGRTLFVVDTLSRTLLAYPVAAGEPALGEPVIVTDFMNMPGKPDGMTMSPAGTLWVAMWGGGCVVELSSSGALLRTVMLPAPNVSSACLMGDGTLLVTTSRMRLGPQQLAEAPLSGAVFRLETR